MDYLKYFNKLGNYTKLLYLSICLTFAPKFKDKSGKSYCCLASQEKIVIVLDKLNDFFKVFYYRGLEYQKMNVKYYILFNLNYEYIILYSILIGAKVK